jgi:hypothetical protein
MPTEAQRRMVIALAAIPRPVREIATLIIDPATGKQIDEELVAIVFADEIKQAQAKRAKNGEPSTHPLCGVELRALRRLKRESIESPFVFVSERGSPFTTTGYRKMIARLGEAARFSFLCTRTCSRFGERGSGSVRSRREEADEKRLLNGEAF